MLKILQARLQEYMNQELPDVPARFSKGRGTRDQLHNPLDRQENIYFCFIDYSKAFDCVITTNWKILKRDGNTRPPYLPPEKTVCWSRTTVRTGHGTMDWFKIGKGV